MSPTELRLVREIAQGKTSREIAAVLDLSGRTVENYRSGICRKLRLTGPNALLQFCAKGARDPVEDWRSSAFDNFCSGA